MHQRSRLLRFCRRNGIVPGMFLLSSAAILGQGCPALQRPVPDPNSGLTGEYVGSERCFTCHSRTHGEWMQTRHEQAYESLVALGEEGNEVCLTCHTTGFGQPGGFQSINTTELLANVGCESCHGPARAHVMDVSNRALRPPVSVTAEWCARCHNGFHHDTYSEWADSAHAVVTGANEVPTGAPAHYFEEGRNTNTCGNCHSGDVLLAKEFNQENNVSESLLTGTAVDQMTAVTCTVCHDPHANTGNAFQPPAGHDFQLRWAEVVDPEPSNIVDATTNPDRFGLCGQCHHSRGVDWTSNARGPHHSVQANFYVGEMPASDGTPLVSNQRSTHRFVFKQCVTCHMQHEAHLGAPNAADASVSGDTQVVTHVGHTFSATASFTGCVASGCHPSETSIQAETQAFQAEVQSRLDAIKARMGPADTWEYSTTGGPAANQQSAIPEQIRKARFLVAYLESDGSRGVHNPPYARAILTSAENLLASIGR